MERRESSEVISPNEQTLTLFLSLFPSLSFAVLWLRRFCAVAHQETAHTHTHTHTLKREREKARAPKQWPTVCNLNLQTQSVRTNEQ